MNTEEIATWKIAKHADICAGMTRLYERKNHDYGDAYAKLRDEYPQAICVRLQDKMNRLKTLLWDNAEQEVNDESIEDTILDIANYCVMELVERAYDKSKLSQYAAAENKPDIQLGIDFSEWNEELSNAKDLKRMLHEAAERGKKYGPNA